MKSRIFSFLAALLFLFTSVAVSVAVIWQIKEDNKKADTAAQQQNAGSNQQEDTAVQPKYELPDAFTTSTPVTELQVTDLHEGDGELVKDGDTVTVFYHGTHAKDGKVFDSAYDRKKPTQLSLNSVIEGWKKGIPGMKVGGQRRLVIPAALAYGEKGQPNAGIEPNEDLVFVVEVTNTQHQ